MVRVPEGRVRGYAGAGPTAREMDFTGRPMRGWVVVGPEATDDDASLEDLGHHRRRIRPQPSAEVAGKPRRSRTGGKPRRPQVARAQGQRTQDGAPPSTDVLPRDSSAPLHFARNDSTPSNLVMLSEAGGEVEASLRLPSPPGRGAGGEGCPLLRHR